MAKAGWRRGGCLHVDAEHVIGPIDRGRDVLGAEDLDHDTPLDHGVDAAPLVGGGLQRDAVLGADGDVAAADGAFPDVGGVRGHVGGARVGGAGVGRVLTVGALEEVLDDVAARDGQEDQHGERGTERVHRFSG